ncbi:hypothetical protein G7043_13280 [Lentzea sp. NEAU-D13]|uniref:Uncharacterized protein n=1 Tax=Lentzea alba TaxID=2714351 RepID=A0A7C9VSR4_9PSEU|nr:hypothetical protein [Lentzea alba]NGY59896.1 hypothetical protein [Lentzea alba]
MGRHTLLRSLLVAAMAFGTVTSAAVTPALADTTATTAAQADLATARRDTVRRTAFSEFVSAELRAEALQALLSNRGDAAIDEFFATGIAKARARATERETNNRRYVQEINRYSPSGSAVRFTSDQALAGSANAQDVYVQSGYERARAADEANNNQHQEHLARLAGEDRAYVAYLAANDPGVQVRAAAQRAIEGDDTQVGLFFKYYWGIGADLDNEGFRRRTLEQNEIWHRAIRALTDAALAAEKAERESSGELARKARLDAIARWDEAAREAGQSSVDWNAEKAKADAQAAAWAQVAEHARSAQSEQDWAAILDRAATSTGSWADEAAWALSQATFWQDLATKAKKSADAARDRELGAR